MYIILRIDLWKFRFRMFLGYDKYFILILINLFTKLLFSFL